MRPRIALATALTGAFAVCGALTACGGGEAQWAAQVDGARIGLEELRARVEPRSADEPAANPEELVLEELEGLVAEQVVLNRAAALGIQISDDEVNARMKQLLGEEAEAADPAYRETVRRQMLQERAALYELAARVRINEPALLHHFEANRDRYAEPPKVEVRQIVVEDQALARHLLGELRGGADFAMLARAHSLSPEAKDGGLLPPYARGEMPEVFDRAFALEPGRLSDVLESPYGYHVFRLEQQLPARPADFESAREQVRAELEREQLAELRRGWTAELRRAADVRVNERALETLQ